MTESNSGETKPAKAPRKPPMVDRQARAAIRALHPLVEELARTQPTPARDLAAAFCREAAKCKGR